MRHPSRLDSASGKTLVPFPCFDLCLTAWSESETVFHGTVVGASILDCFATGVFLDDLEVDASLFGIVTIISLTNFDSRGWNTGRGLVADDCCSAGACGYTAAGSGCARMVLNGLVARARLLVCLRVGDAGSGCCLLETRATARVRCLLVHVGWFAASDYWRRRQSFVN